MEKTFRAILVLLAVPAFAAAQSVAFAGTVVDSAKRPLGNAEVSLPGMGLTTMTTDRGVFRIEGVSAGIHRVTVKHIGYTQLDTTMVFDQARSLEWVVTLGRMTRLDSVVVSAPADPLLAEFNENRKRGFGRFLTRADLEKKGNAALPTVLRSLGGIGIMRSNVGQSYVSAARGPISRCQPTGMANLNAQAARAAQEATDECLRRERLYYVPDEIEIRSGVKRSCYALVYVDRMLMNSGQPTPPFDVNSFAIDQVEAIEWYESPSQTPARYSARQAQCGVLVLHLRKRK